MRWRRNCQGEVKVWRGVGGKMRHSSAPAGHDDPSAASIKFSHWCKQQHKARVSRRQAIASSRESRISTKDGHTYHYFYIGQCHHELLTVGFLQRQVTATASSVTIISDADLFASFQSSPPPYLDSLYSSLLFFKNHDDRPTPQPRR